MRSRRRNCRATFAAAIIVIAGVWLVALPRMANQLERAERTQRLERYGIDPAAIFYTDHPRTRLVER